MARGVDLEEVFGRFGGFIDGLAELEGDYGILGAVDDQDGSGDVLESGLGVELAVG